MTTVRNALCSALAILWLAVPASADPIQITGGALLGPGGAASTKSVTLTGEGFLFNGHTGFGVFEPGETCLVGGCVAGATIDLAASWSGNDLSGTATVNGTTYTNVGSLIAPTALSAAWAGSLLVPTGFSGGVLTAPFSFTGTFFNNTAMGTTTLDLLGAGTATLHFIPTQVPGQFALSSVNYAFDSAEPVPEPMSMLLVGTGLAGLARLRRRRDSQTI